MATQYILKAREFKDRVTKSRVYGKVEREEMAEQMQRLESEFNNLADKQPVIMDAMLETLENLKSMRKNYEEELETYNFDHKAFLDDTVLGRDRVYLLKKLEEVEEDSSGDED